MGEGNREHKGQGKGKDDVKQKRENRVKQEEKRTTTAVVEKVFLSNTTM